eukprot:CAMPEP_0171064290 /NCGR_PEP_ID=MMETSP0766_2-20121228/6189_1 /TAXON_ID=439317 /ORGANISM="Gambierdiscus australes, Strain CAWD 149" /LENGTH=477 /DNA_ID=CAMNT_0011520307 /DNA_START=61 /DNA_END=1494 /DNA_ORIENTATION=+
MALHSAGGWPSPTALGFAALALGSQSRVVVAHKRMGEVACPCLDSLPQLANLTLNTATNQKSRAPASGTAREPIHDCLVAESVDRLQRPGEKYCYPTDYGMSRCEAWDLRLEPECAVWAGEGKAWYTTPEHCKGELMLRNREDCEDLFSPGVVSLPWCREKWCYVNPNDCNLTLAASYYFPGRDLWYSYETCDSSNYFEIWNVVQLEMCQLFAVVEKPYPIMFLSCWACAFLQQLIDTTRLLAEQQDRLCDSQRGYLLFQLCILVTETFANMLRIPWREHDFWSNYNLYVYVFINSSVFVRATMMFQIVWDWYNARLLKYPVLPNHVDHGSRWTEERRAALLVVIFQFMSSLGVFGVICITHLFAALFVYYWIFMVVCAVFVKSRSWVRFLRLDPESRFGRALVMGTNSFMSCMGIQVLVTSMVRVYAGEWRGGYLAPLRNDFLSRRLDVWYSCHLGKNISTVEMLQDQDFINLFLR